MDAIKKIYKIGFLLMIITFLVLLSACDNTGRDIREITDTQDVGIVIGYVTAPDETTPIIGATVLIDNPLQTTTDQNGFYQLANVPQGKQTIIVFKGNFRAEIIVNVVRGQTTQAEIAILQPTGKIGVNDGHYDDIAGILTDLGFEYESINSDILSDSSQLSEFVVLFFECGGINISEGSNEAENLKDFIANGGYLYASDYALDVAAVLFPEKVKELSKEGKGVSEDISAEIINENIIKILGKNEIKLNYYDSPGWNVIKSISDDVKIDIIADIETYSEVIKESPLLVHFSHGDGMVILTTFHNAANATDDMIVILQQMSFGL